MGEMLKKVINETIKRIDRRLKIIAKTLDADPVTDMFEARKKACEIFKKHGTDYSKIAKLIGPLADKEKRALATLKRRQRSFTKLMDEQFKLEHEKAELTNDLFMIELREKRGF